MTMEQIFDDAKAHGLSIIAPLNNLDQTRAAHYRRFLFRTYMSTGLLTVMACSAELYKEPVWEMWQMCIDHIRGMRRTTIGGYHPIVNAVYRLRLSQALANVIENDRQGAHRIATALLDDHGTWKDLAAVLDVFIPTSSEYYRACMVIAGQMPDMKKVQDALMVPDAKKPSHLKAILRFRNHGQHGFTTPPL